MRVRGGNSMVESLPSKQVVASSSLVLRSIKSPYWGFFYMIYFTKILRGEFMIDEILAYVDKIEKVFSTLKIDLILEIIVNIIVITVLFKLVDIFGGKLKQKFKSNDNSSPLNHIVPVLGKIIKFLIGFIVVVSFLQSHGYSLTSLIAGFGITGLAVGFAAQQTIASMFGTVAVLTDKVYRIGDYIKINDVEGTVEAISLRSTKIRTLQNFVVAIPNDTVANSVIENISKASKRRIELVVGVTYDTSDEKIQKAIDILNNVVTERSDMYKDHNVFVDALDSSSINIKLISYAKTKSYDSYAKIKGSIIQEVVRKFRVEGIDFAFPSTTVYIAKDSE